jgi:hypothetical protein
MGSGWMQQTVGRRQVVLVVALAVVAFGVAGVIRVLGQRPARVDAQPPVRVPLFIDPAAVDHGSRFRFTFDPPEALAELRQQERLDDVVVGSTSDRDAFRRLMEWTGDQWQLGTPSPYPPPDARVILRDVRAGFTGGFCAQYCFVLTQAIQSFGIPARLVTITGHEVVEAWLRDEGRWVVLDPTYRLQVVDAVGRPLDALEIRRGVERGDAVAVTAGHRLPEAEAAYLARYRRFAVWLRNDLVSRPMNFTDFSRYLVWFDPPDEAGRAPESLVTKFAEDLYPADARGGP